MRYDLYMNPERKEDAMSWLIFSGYRQTWVKFVPYWRVVTPAPDLVAMDAPLIAIILAGESIMMVIREESSCFSVAVIL